jgi:integrase
MRGHYPGTRGQNPGIDGPFTAERAAISRGIKWPLLAEYALPATVEEILGHTSLMLTPDTYSHVTPDLQRDAAKRLNALFDSKKLPDRELE